MVFDFIVMALVMLALLRLSGVSSLWKILFLDGLGYYVGESSSPLPRNGVLIGLYVLLVAFAFYLACTIVAYGNWSVLLAYVSLL